MKYRFLLMAVLMVSTSMFLSSCEDGWLSNKGDVDTGSTDTSSGVDNVDPGTVNIFPRIVDLALYDNPDRVIDSTSLGVPIPAYFEPDSVTSFKHTFEVGDKVALSMWKYSKDFDEPTAVTKLDNSFTYTFNGGTSWSQDEVVKWVDDETLTSIIAVYPVPAEAEPNYSSYPYDIMPQKPFMWAKMDQIRPVAVPMTTQFTNVSARIEASIEAATEYSGASIIVKDIALLCYTSANLNCYTQKINLLGTGKEVLSLVSDSSYTNVASSTATLGYSKKKKYMYSTMVLPQQVTAIQLDYSVLPKGADSTEIVDFGVQNFQVEAMNISSNMAYQVTLKVGQDKVILEGIDSTIVTMPQWDGADGSLSGGTVNQGETTAKPEV